MTRTIILITILSLVAINQVNCKDALDINKLLSQGIAKKFEVGLKHVTEKINEKAVPFIQLLKRGGCNGINTAQNLVKTETDTRAEACVELTESVGQLERLALAVYDLAQQYANSTQLGVQNATACLQTQDMALVSICLLRAVDDYNDHLEILNKQLQDIITNDVDLINLIIEDFIRCFEEKPQSLNEIAVVYAKTYCTQSNTLS